MTRFSKKLPAGLSAVSTYKFGCVDVEDISFVLAVT
jgi:hypothetical protein